MKSAQWMVAICLAWQVAVDAEGADKYVALELKDVKVLEGRMPQNVLEGGWPRAGTVALDGPGEAYVGGNRFNDPAGIMFVARVPEGQKATGLMFLSNEHGKLRKIKVEADNAPETVGAADKESPTDRNKLAKEYFNLVKENYYALMLQQQYPGAAWFRHQQHAAMVELGFKVDLRDRRIEREFDEFHADVFALFSGGRAVSENLQLSRPLRDGRRSFEQESVDVSTLPGITIQAIDWKPRLKDVATPLDPLASAIPEDQHVVFFPSFKALVRMADEAEQQGTPLLRLAEPRSEDARTLARYERQLGLSLSGLGRLLGPKVIDSVALTGSDIDFRLGTDLAVVFETANPGLLENLLIAQMTVAHAHVPKVQAVHGTLEEISYRGSVSDQRQASAYVASLKNAVVVTNSLAQLKRLAEVQVGKTPMLGDLEEFRFFRQRYPRGEEETAFLFLSDATIRRWCGARWRIASARRLQAASALAEAHAEKFESLVQGEVGPATLSVASEIDLGDVTLDGSGIRSSKFGRLDFITPVVEMPLKMVTASEADAYRQWRNGYQSNWSWAFDPIALRVVADDRRLAGDLTVMPLIVRTEYREYVDVSQGAKLKPNAGDPHDALWHVVLALNPESELLKKLSGFVSTMSGPQKLNPLGWLGGSIAVYMDDDPIFAQLNQKGKADSDSDELARNLRMDLTKLPIGVRIEVRDPLKLAMFVVGLRAYIEETLSGLITWENVTYNGRSYVKVSTKRDGVLAQSEPSAFYYLATSESLTLALNEGVIHRVLDRLKSRSDANGKVVPAFDAKPANQRSWIGENLALRVQNKGWSVLMKMDSNVSQQMMQKLSWSNLPILNEWQRRWPDQDPVEIHQKVWGVRLICPGGGKYVWNETWKTMESTLYGHPGEPKEGPTFAPLLDQFSGGDFGLTFEPQGLRARVDLRRAAKK